MIDGPLILASASSTRARLLSAAGIRFETIHPGIDERALKAALKSDGIDSAAAAETLAEAKALQISLRVPEALILASDQLLVCGEVWFDKPRDYSNLIAQIQTLQGRWHSLWTAAVLMRGGQRIWHTRQQAKLLMRPLEPEEIKAYANQAGESVLSCVGGYEIEGLGANLFTKIEGDTFVIQGLALLEVLEALRNQGRAPL